MQQVASGRTLMVALMLLFASSITQAFVDPPTFNPAAPNSAQPVTVSVRTGLCHTFGVGVGAPPRRIERSPGIVDVIAPGVIAFDGFCIWPVATEQFAVGALPPGEYQVRIWIIDATFAYTQTTQVASAPLTVTQGPVAPPIPMLGTGAFIMMVLLMLLVASRLLGGHRQMMQGAQ